MRPNGLLCRLARFFYFPVFFASFASLRLGVMPPFQTGFFISPA